MTKRNGWILPAVLTLVSGVVCAQAPSTYPTKPVRFIVPHVPGGASDVLSRISTSCWRSATSSINLLRRAPILHRGRRNTSPKCCARTS